MRQSNPAALLQVRDGAWAVSGPLDMESVPSVLRQARALFDDPSVVVDLKAVDRIDSAGLALIVNWLREAHRRAVTLRVQNIPARMASLARVCGLDKLLPAESFSA